MLGSEQRALAWNYLGPPFVGILESQPQLLLLGQKDHDHGGQSEANGVSSPK